jgi:hypothetical protein
MIYFYEPIDNGILLGRHPVDYRVVHVTESVDKKSGLDIIGKHIKVSSESKYLI